MTYATSYSYSALNTYKKCPRQFEQQYKLRKVKSAGGAAADAGKIVHEQIEHFIEGKRDALPSAIPPDGLVQNLRAGRKAGLPIKVELRLAVNDDLEPCAFFARNTHVLLRGALDVEIKTGASVTAIDWKTGKRWPQDQAFQADVYHTLLRAHYPELETRVIFDFLANGRDPVDGADGSETREVMSLIDAIEAETRFDPSPSPLCRFCPVVTCEYNEAGG